MFHPNEAIWKAINPKKLCELLANLPDDILLSPNRVGNIMMCRGSEGTYLGYIDIAEETVEWVADAQT